MKLTITVPLPPKYLSPNWNNTGPRADRTRRAKAREAKQQSHDAALMAMGDEWGVGVNWSANQKLPKWKSASIRAVFYLKNRRGAGADADNRIATLKPHLDGIALAGVVENDRGFVWASPPIEHRIDRDRPRVEIIVEQLEAP